MGLNPRKMYGFPRFPLTQDTQTVEQDIKLAANDEVMRSVDPRLEKLASEKKFEPLDITVEVKIKIENEGEEPEAEEDDEAVEKEEPETDVPDVMSSAERLRNLMSKKE